MKKLYNFPLRRIQKERVAPTILSLELIAVVKRKRGLKDILGLLHIPLETLLTVDGQRRH